MLRRDTGIPGWGSTTLNEFHRIFTEYEVANRVDYRRVINRYLRNLYEVTLSTVKEDFPALPHLFSRADLAVELGYSELPHEEKTLVWAGYFSAYFVKELCLCWGLFAAREGRNTLAMRKLRVDIEDFTFVTMSLIAEAKRILPRDYDRNLVDIPAPVLRAAVAKAHQTADAAAPNGDGEGSDVSAIRSLTLLREIEKYYEKPKPEDEWRLDCQRQIWEEARRVMLEYEDRERQIQAYMVKLSRFQSTVRGAEFMQTGTYINDYVAYCADGIPASHLCLPPVSSSQGPLMVAVADVTHARSFVPGIARAKRVVTKDIREDLCSQIPLLPAKPDTHGSTYEKYLALGGNPVAGPLHFLLPALRATKPSHVGLGNEHKDIFRRNEMHGSVDQGGENVRRWFSGSFLGGVYIDSSTSPFTADTSHGGSADPRVKFLKNARERNAKGFNCLINPPEPLVFRTIIPSIDRAELTAQNLLPYMLLCFPGTMFDKPRVKPEVATYSPRSVGGMEYVVTGNQFTHTYVT